jgi:hypothetical protein
MPLKNNLDRAKKYISPIIIFNFKKRKEEM